MPTIGMELIGGILPALIITLAAAAARALTKYIEAKEKYVTAELERHIELYKHIAGDAPLQKAKPAEIKNGYSKPAPQLQERPILTNCPNCGAPVDLTAKSCPYCDTPYLAAAPGSTEELRAAGMTPETLSAALQDGIMTPNDWRRLMGMPEL